MKQRMHSLDALKGIAAVFVILIHERFPGTFGRTVAELGKFAVPIFFMVSGYFSSNASRAKIKKSIWHVVALIFVAYGLNVCRLFIQQGFSLQGTVSYLAHILTPKSLFLWLGFNVTTFSGVAWFLFALLYSYCFHYLFYNQFASRHIFWLVPVLFGGGLLVTFVLPILGFSGFGTNSVWFCGLPYYLCGRWIKKHAEKVMSFSIGKTVLCATLAMAVVILNVFLPCGLAYLGTIFLSISLFILCVRYPNVENAFLERIGSIYAFCVYIFHPLIIHIFNWILPLKDNIAIGWMRPALVIFVTIAAAALYNAIREKVKMVALRKTT